MASYRLGIERLLQSTKRTCLILDGGMGTSLCKLGLNEHDAWSSTKHMTEKRIRSAVKQVHQNFLKSGVDILTTNTYDSITINSDQKLDINCIKEAITVAREAIEEHKVLQSIPSSSCLPTIALSVGTFATTIPMRAETANREQEEGKDMRREECYGFPRKDLDKYFEILLSDESLNYAKSTGVSFLAFETVGDLTEVEVICNFLRGKSDILHDTGLYSWVSLTCLNDEVVDTGGSIIECVKMLVNCDQVTAIGINCTEPHLIESIMKKIDTVFEMDSKKPIVVYPNSGEVYLSRKLAQNEEEHWSKTQNCEENWSFPDAAMGWVTGGASIVGGCCRINADDIKDFAQQVDSKTN